MTEWMYHKTLYIIWSQGWWDNFIKRIFKSEADARQQLKYLRDRGREAWIQYVDYVPKLNPYNKGSLYNPDMDNFTLENAEFIIKKINNKPYYDLDFPYSGIVNMIEQYKLLDPFFKYDQNLSNCIYRCYYDYRFHGHFKYSLQHINLEENSIVENSIKSD